jgi:hypothetical protein
VPARVAANIRGDRVGLRDGAVAQFREPVERDLDVGWREVLGDALCLAVCAARGAGERVAFAKGIEHLTAHAAGRVRSERRAHLAAVTLCGLDKSNDAPRDQVLAIRPAAPRIKRSCRDRSREGKVRDDALSARRSVHSRHAPPARNVVMLGEGVNSELTQISTEVFVFFDRYAYPDWLRTHSLLVGRIAETIAGAHRGVDTDARDIVLAGYLHDIGKSPLLAGDAREHNDLSALILAAEGLGGAVEPARRHSIYTVLDPAKAPATLADKIVYVADRRGGMRVEPVDVRARETARRHPRFAAEIERAIPIATALEREVFAGLPFAPEELEAQLIT